MVFSRKKSWWNSKYNELSVGKKNTKVVLFVSLALCYTGKSRRSPQFFTLLGLFHFFCQTSDGNTGYYGTWFWGYGVSGFVKTGHMITEILGCRVHSFPLPRLVFVSCGNQLEMRAPEGDTFDGSLCDRRRSIVCSWPQSQASLEQMFYGLKVGWRGKFFLAYQNQHVSKPTWVKLQCNRHSRSVLKYVLKIAKLAPYEKRFLKRRSLIGHLYDV